MNPSIVLRWISLGILGCAASAYAAQSEWVYPGTDGKLVYKTTPLGDRIMDFSYAGYMGGGVALPDVPVKQTVKPSGDHDDTALIQKAIDQVSALALQNGFRGTVLLESGSYNCAGTITISADGVVLRGNDATVNLIGRPHLAISVRKAGAYRRRPSFDDEPETNSNDQRDSFQTSVSDTYVPSGTLCFHVASAAHLAVGDDIIIRKPVTQAWVKFMHMDDLVRDGRPQTWIRSPGYIITQRKIAAISGNEITLDVPLTDSLDARYLNPPGASVLKAAAPTEVSQVGLESLHIQCPPQSFNHDQQHFVAIRMDGQDCWIRDTVADETMDSIGVNGRRITLERVTVNRKALHTGSSKPAEFAPNATQVLLDRCAVHADNVWFTATGAEQAGPIVLLNCTFTGDSDAESHQRWSTGILYDNCQAPQGGITLRDRGSMGSGHGWTMGWGVVWNCAAKDYIVQNPPGAINWLIGCVGDNKLAAQPFGQGPNLPQGTIDSPGQPVSPRSLYLTQLKERLGPQALKNIGYSSADDLASAEGAAK